MTLRCAALAPGTWRNCERHATCYIAHMRTRGFDYIAPTAYDIAHYTASLQRKLPSPASVANALPGARVWL